MRTGEVVLRAGHKCPSQEELAPNVLPDQPRDLPIIPPVDASPDFSSSGLDLSGSGFDLSGSGFDFSGLSPDFSGSDPDFLGSGLDFSSSGLDFSGSGLDIFGLTELSLPTPAVAGVGFGTILPFLIIATSV